MNILGRTRTMFADKAFMKKTLAIALPVTVQALLNNVLNMIDTLMIGQLGEVTIAAVGLANKVFFVFSLLLFGICSGAGILAAQYYGEDDIPNLRRVLGMTLLLGVTGALLFMVPVLLIPDMVMRIFTPSAESIAIGCTYLVIVCFSYPFTAVTQGYIAILRAANQVMAPVIISMVSILVNIILNYGLIFGKLGLPKMGVAGAALATLIARVVECISLILVIYLKKSPAAAQIREMLSLSRNFVKKFFITAAPVIANEFIWGLGVTIYSLVYGRMGDGAVAAITICQSVEQVYQVIFQGLSAATAVILGNILGAGDLEQADEYGKNFILLQFILSLAAMGVCGGSRELLLGMFAVSEEVAGFTRGCFTAFILYIPAKNFNYVNIVGILRSGGDTGAALFLDTTGVWLIGIPLAFLGGMVLQLPIYIVYAMVMAEEVYKLIFGFLRYRKKLWLRKIV